MSAAVTKTAIGGIGSAVSGFGDAIESPRQFGGEPRHSNPVAPLYESQGASVEGPLDHNPWPRGQRLRRSGQGIYRGLAGLWCAALGFGEERLVEAARRQMERCPTITPSPPNRTSPSIELAERLIALVPVPMSKVFFNNSGSEANDTADQAGLVLQQRARPAAEEEDHRAASRPITASPSPRASLTGLPNNHRDFDLPIADIRAHRLPAFLSLRQARRERGATSPRGSPTSSTR